MYGLICWQILLLGLDDCRCFVEPLLNKKKVCQCVAWNLARYEANSLAERDEDAEGHFLAGLYRRWLRSRRLVKNGWWDDRESSRHPLRGLLHRLTLAVAIRSTERETPRVKESRVHPVPYTGRWTVPTFNRWEGSESGICGLGIKKSLRTFGGRPTEFPAN